MFNSDMFSRSENYRSDLFDIEKAARDIVGFEPKSEYDFKRAAWDIVKDLK